MDISKNWRRTYTWIKSLEFLFVTKVSGSSTDTITLHPFLIGIKTSNWYEIVTNPHPANTPHHSQSSYEDSIHYQSENSMSWQMIIYIPQIMLTITSKMVNKLST